MSFTCRCRTRCSALNVPSSIAPQRCCFRRFARADSILLISRLWSGWGPWFARALRTVWRQSPSSFTQAKTWSANSCSTLPSTEMFIKCWGKIADKAKELDRDMGGIPRALYISINLNEEDEALSEGDGFMRAYYGIPYEVVSKQLLCVFGPAQKCIDTIKRYQEAGADYFIVRFASPNQMEQLDKFTELVAPNLD